MLDFPGALQGSFDFGHGLEDRAEFFLPFGIKRGGGDEFGVLAVDGAVIALLDEALEFAQGLLLQVGLLENIFPDLGQGGVARPDFCRGAQLGFHCGAVA